MTQKLRNIVLPFFLLACVAPGVRAESVESSSSRGQASFLAAMGGALPRLSPAGRGLPARAFTAAGKGGELDKYMDEHVSMESQPQSAQNPAVGAALELDLAAMRNRHFKTKLSYPLSGKQVWISGSFDRAKNAYVSILVDGQEPVFFNIAGLVDKEQVLNVGSARYKVFLSPNIIHKLKSEIVLENMADEDQQKRISVTKLLGAATSAGEAISLGGQSYHVFYFDDIKDGRLDGSRQTLAFAPAIDDFTVYLVGGEQVASDKINVFPMFKDRRVGLMQSGGKLKIYDNP